MSQEKIKNTAKYFIYQHSYTDRKQLKKIMYQALTHPRLVEKISRKNSENNHQDLYIFVNLEEVNLSQSLQDKKIILKFRLFKKRDQIKWISNSAKKWLFSKKSLQKKNLQFKYQQMNCKTLKNTNSHLKIMPCMCPTGKCKSKHKIFYQQARELKDYIQKLSNKQIDLNEHNKLFDHISHWETFRNHNLDIPVLHFK